MSNSFINELLKFYGQDMNMKNRYEIHPITLLPSSKDKEEDIIQLSVFDNESNSYIDPPESELIRTVANMNMEYNNYKKTVKDYIDGK